MCYSNLISTLQALNNNKDADDVQVQYSQWLRNNPKHHKPNTLEELNAQPQPFTEFMEKLNVMEKQKDAWEKGMQICYMLKIVAVLMFLL